MDELIQVTGLEDVQRMLKEAPKHVVVTGYAKALRRSINVIAETLQMLTPEGSNHTNDDILPLNESIVTDVQVDSNGRGGVARVGYGKSGHVALFVEYGHVMKTHKPGSSIVGHVPAHPFMRPAFDQSAAAATAAFQESITETVENEFPHA